MVQGRRDFLHADDKIILRLMIQWEKYIKLYSYFHTQKICDKKSDLDGW